MQKKHIWFGVIGLVVIIAIWGIGSYNSLVSKNEAVTAQWSQVDTQLQRRFDLIPNVVNTVKGITKQEQTIFTEIAEARSKYAGAQTPDEKASSAGAVESSLGRLLVIAENYPDLKSSQSFHDLTIELEGTENRISVERMKYNDMVRDLDTSIKRFPTSIIASMAGVHERAYFEVADGAKTVPNVNFAQ